MRRPLALVAGTLILLVPSGTAAAYPTRVQAMADEFALALSRISVPNKRVRIELVNFGEDPHDLRLRRIGGTRTFVIPGDASGRADHEDLPPPARPLPRMVLRRRPPRAGHARDAPRPP
jgi:hypothetical protein